MPKLSHDSLKKRFSCVYCAETFRTRQGLSGHIQFKHMTTKPKPEKLDGSYFASRQTAFAEWGATCQLPKSTAQAILALITNWAHVKYFFSSFDVELTNQDFKTYFLSGLGKVFIEPQV